MAVDLGLTPALPNSFHECLRRTGVGNQQVNRLPEQRRIVDLFKVPEFGQVGRRVRHSDFVATDSFRCDGGELLELSRLAAHEQFGHVDVTDVGTAFRFVHVMRGDQERDTLGRQLEEKIPQLATCHGINAGGRLVEEEHFRFVDQRTGQCETLLPTAGQRAGQLMNATIQRGHLHHRLTARCEPIALESVDPAIELEVLQHGQVGVQAELLRHVSDATFDQLGVVPHVMAQHQGISGRRCRECPGACE